jgi:hypothetical protein
MLKWYGHAVGVEDKRWPKRLMTWSPGERWRRGRNELKWEKEMEAVMNQKNLTSDDTINRQLCRIKSSNRRTAGKLTDIYLCLMVCLIMCYWKEIRVINTA